MRAFAIAALLSAIALDSSQQLASAQTASSPWRLQSRDEPAWVTAAQSATYRGISATRELPKHSLAWRGLDPFFAARVESAFNAAKVARLEPIFVSGFRPGSYQREIADSYAMGGTSGLQFQPTSRSYHTLGLAVDIQIGRPEKMLKFVQILHERGLAFTVDGDPNHIEIVRSPALGPTFNMRVPSTYREFVQLELPTPPWACEDCVPRRIVARPDTVVAAQREREYRVNSEVKAFFDNWRREMNEMRLDKPDPFRQGTGYRSPFGDKFKFESPFGPGVDRPSREPGYLGNFRFDDT